MTKLLKDNQPKVLIYDIEVTPVLAWIWRCGEQYVGHHQLHEELNMTKVICITYRWLHEKKSKALVFDIGTLDDHDIIQTFDSIIQKADVIIGKNSDRFDNKHLNFRRMMHGLPAITDWIKRTDDLEKQMRRHFNMQSFSLDYFSKITGSDGKIKMNLQDWIDIVYRHDTKALNKMVKYGLKDVDDTAELVLKVWPYVTPKANMAAIKHTHACVNCGAKGILNAGPRVHGGSDVMTFWCPSHGGYAGRATIKKDGSFGKIRK